jgi:hypothetical protein
MPTFVPVSTGCAVRAGGVHVLCGTWSLQARREAK